MSTVDDPSTFGRTRLSFANEVEIDDFVATLDRFERGEISPDQWRGYRLVRGTYGQRQAEDAQIFRLTLDTVDKPNLQLITFPGKIASSKKKVSPEAAPDADSDLTGDEDGTKEPAIDPERDETLNILSDLVNLSRGPTTASTTTAH